MRRLAWGSACFCGAVLAGQLLLPFDAVPAAAGALASAGLLGFLLPRKWGRMAAALCLCGALGFFYLWGWSAQAVLPARTMDGATLRVRAQVTDWSPEGRAELRVTVPDSGRQVGAVLYCTAPCSLVPGDRLEVEARWTYLGPGHTGGLGLKAAGLFLKGTQTGPLFLTPAGEIPLADWGTAVRMRLSARMGELLPGEEGDLLRAVTLSDRQGLSQGRSVKLQTAGLSHTAAASGLHLTFLTGLLLLLVRNRRLGAVLAACGALFFAAVIGFTPSILRAAVLQLCLLLAPLLGRESDTPTALGLAGAVILLLNPYSAAGVGAQLSFACMAGLLLVGGRLTEGLRGLLPRGNRVTGPVYRFLSATLGASAATLLFTFPLSLLYFGGAPVLSVFSNLLALFPVSVAFGLGLTAAALSLLFPPLGALGALLVRPLLAWVLTVTDWAVKIPFFSVGADSPLVGAAVAACYGLMLALWAVGRRRKRPLGRRGTLVSAGSAAAVLALSLCVTAALEYRTPLRVSLVDVGQGQSVVLCAGSTALVADCGGGLYSQAGRRTAEFLLRHGRTRLDALLLTHFHADHANGVLTLMECVEVGELWIPQKGESGLRLEILDRARELGIPVRVFGWDAELRLEALSCRLFVPTLEGGENEQCMALLAGQGDFDVLVTGDLTQEGEEALLNRHRFSETEVLVAGHHGAADACGSALLQALRPRVALLSAGEGNPYGHPSGETLARLEKLNIPAYCTIQNGTITITEEELP